MDSIIHVKATHEGEVRRFQCAPSFEILESSLRTIFGCKPTDQILITFLDDENEYCRISCQIELDYAVTLPSPLRLVMKLVSPKPEPQAAEPVTVPNEAVKARLDAINAALETPNLPPHKREKLNRRKECLSAKLSGQAPPANKACNRERVLEERLAMINSAMEQPNLPPQRYENLSRRKDAIIAKLHGLPSSASYPSPSSPESTCTQADGPRPCSDRLQARLAVINSKLGQPDLPPQKLENLTRKKAWIEAKLAGGNADFACPAKSGMDRTQFWQMRLNHINAALEQPDLPPQRRENLTRKKENLTAKLAAGESSSDSDSKFDKTQFWQMRLKHINDALAHPDLPPHRRENLTLKKAKFEEKLAGKTTEVSSTTPQGSPNPWNRPHHPWAHHGGPHQGFGPHHHHPWAHHGGPHGFGGPHHHGGPPHAPHGFGCPPPPTDSGFHCPPFGCPPPEPHPWGPRGHHHHGHPGGWGARGANLEQKLAWINQTLEQPGLPPHKAAGLLQRKIMIESKIAQQQTSGAKTEEKSDARGELVALRGAVGAAKVNLKNARQSGLKDAELSPFIDAVANAKAALVKRRLELKSASQL